MAAIKGFIKSPKKKILAVVARWKPTSKFLKKMDCNMEIQRLHAERDRGEAPWIIKRLLREEYRKVRRWSAGGRRWSRIGVVVVREVGWSGAGLRALAGDGLTRGRR